MLWKTAVLPSPEREPLSPTKVAGVPFAAASTRVIAPVARSLTKMPPKPAAASRLPAVLWNRILVPSADRDGPKLAPSACDPSAAVETRVMAIVTVPGAGGHQSRRRCGRDVKAPSGGLAKRMQPAIEGVDWIASGCCSSATDFERAN